MKSISPVLVCVALLLIGCDESPHAPDPLVGTWESHSFRMQIGYSNDKYMIDLDNHRSMLSGQYIGESIDGGLKVIVPLAGEQHLLLSASGDRLVFIGEQLDKVLP